MTTAPNIAGMLSGERQVRLVIQAVPARGKASPQYRLVVYPEHPDFHGPLVFSTREDLLSRLSSAIPQFDVSLVRQTDGEARVLFAGAVDLAEAQIARLYGR